MNRTLAFLAAVLLTSVAFGSAGFATSVENIRFELKPSAKAADRVQLSLRSGQDHRNHNMSSSFRAADLAGLDLARLHASGPVAFALIRDAGRLDCFGTAQAKQAQGACRFTENAAFSNVLVSRGIARPSRGQAYGLTLLSANRNLADALHAARYPMPGVDEYIAMTAVGVTPAYIAEMARAGYRPADSKRFIEFKAVGVTPQYISALSRAGYANLPASKVVQLAAMNIDPEFIRGFERIGYRNLPVDSLVQLKALNVTPEFVEQVRRSGMRSPTPDQLVQMKALGWSGRARRR